MIYKLQLLPPLLAMLLQASSETQLPLPIISPVPSLTDSSCRGINCLQGSCVELNKGLIPFRCQCNKGWSNLFDISFLGCGVPDCNLNLTCDKASPITSPAPASSPAPIDNFALLDPCTWRVCGNGDCVITNNESIIPSYVCQCHEGYYNLFNSSSATCVPNCSLGANCSDLGIPLTPGSAAPSSPMNPYSSNPKATGCLLPTLQWSIMAMIALSLQLLSL